MSKRFIYLVSIVCLLSIAISAQATPIPVSVDPSVEAVIGDDGNLNPNKSFSSYNLQVSNLLNDISQGRRVTLISYDISGLKKDYQLYANMTLSILGGNSSGKVDIYGVIEDQDNISSGITWKSAPGVKTGQPIGYPVALDEADLTGKLLSFTSPARDVRASVGSAALDDFLNSDTDGTVTLLLAPAGSGVNALMKSSKYSDGGVILEGEITTGKNIVFVSFHGADDAPSAAAAGAGFTEAPDVGYTDLLNADGHNVTRYISTGTPDPNVLNAADLVIVSRSVGSTGYQNDGATAWNSITAPMIIMQGWALRNSRMGYTTGGTMVDITGDVKLAVSDPTHPIFDGIALTNGTMDNAFAGIVTYPTDPNLAALGLSINSDPVNFYGTVLGAIADSSDPNAPANGPVGGMVIGEWWAGAKLTHSGGAGTDALAGHRLVFLTGSRESGGITAETAGMYDLSADGAQILLNAVAYMITPPESKGNIVWVSEWNSNPDTGLPYDQGWIDLLRAGGYVVDANTAGTYVDFTEGKIANLESADMIIISRNSNSGGYAGDVNEVTQWNSFETPIIMMTPWIARSNRWEWINSTSINEYDPETFMDVVAVDHPVFAGITTEAIDTLNIVDVIDENVDLGQNSFIITPDVGNGNLLAQRMDDGSIWIAEWEAGIPCYADSTQIPAGRRMLFTAGGGGGQTAGSMNLNADGQKMYLNAIKYMLAPEPVSIEVENFSFELPGTEKIKGWNGEGVSDTPAEDIPGWASDTAAADSGVESDWPGSTDGVWTGFLMGDDPSIWNLTDHIIAEGEYITFKIDLQDNWTDGGLPDVTISLYYDDAGSRVTVASATVTPLDQSEGGWTEFSVSFANAPGSIGKQLGIEIDNLLASSWIGMDNARVDVISPE
jgi:hypothetical protein